MPARRPVGQATKRRKPPWAPPGPYRPPPPKKPPGRPRKPTEDKKRERDEAAAAARAEEAIDLPAVDLDTYRGRQLVRREVVALLARGVRSSRAQELSTLLRAVKDAGRESEIDGELDELRKLGSELRIAREEKARTRSGVVRQDQAPQLPRRGSANPN